MDPHSSSASLKQLQKQIACEERQEDKLLQHALKDLSHAHKVQSRAQKAQSTAAKAVRKAVDRETSALEALNKATHKLDVAVADIHKAENDAKMKEKKMLAAQRGLDDIKARADTLAREQQEHRREREVKLASFEKEMMTLEECVEL